MSEMVDAFGENTGLGRLGFALEEVGEVGEKRGMNRHPE